MILLFWLAILVVLAPHAAVSAQEESDARAILASMTPEERVGQLFLITFMGDSVQNEDAIAELVRDYRVGGVVLLPQNDNLSGFGDPNQTPAQVTSLVNDLQRLSLFGSLPEIVVPVEGDEPTPTPAPTVVPVVRERALPLLIALTHEGSPYEGHRPLGGLTRLPTKAAIAAAWDPEFARQVGDIAGTELAGIGVNMLVGPSLDVLENPVPYSAADSGTLSFGGDPYWVGRMGQSYTVGVHEGSDGRVAVIGGRFPGGGSSDRPTDEEVPTVQKSLEQLKQIELAPFVAVTTGAPQESAAVDALLTTHIRYQGFQGNIRATTAPVSFDPQALQALMSLPEFAPWREEGGLIVSDSLGARSVRRFYDATEQDFPHRVVAKDALLAGNDLLYLSEFGDGSSSYEEQIDNIKDTITWFQEKYETDQSFEQRVDDAALRILQLKLDLYDDDFRPQSVLVNEANPNLISSSAEPILFDLAQQATTLIAPSPSELAERLASPPGSEDRIIFFTDVREARQCSTCPLEAIVEQNALAERLLALYGPDASGQLSESQISSFSFADLNSFLDAGPGTILLPTPAITVTTPITQTTQPLEVTPTPSATPPAGFAVQESIRDVDWIIFALLDGSEESVALNRFLTERPDIARDAQVIVYAFDVPYLLDSTEISNLTAYFGSYSTADAFIDTAVRALFQETSLSGKSPVSIDGVGYDLFVQTQPDPQQIIELFAASGSVITDPQSQEPLSVEIGDTLQLSTGPIVDRNGHIVPDGTIVRFVQQDRIQGAINIIAERATTDGVASLGYVLEASTGPGQFRITAASGQATISQAVDIAIEEEAQVTIVEPTRAPTSTPSPTATATSTITPSPTATPAPTATPQPLPPPPEPGVRIELSEFQMLIALFAGLLTTIVAALILARDSAISSAALATWTIWGLIGALIFYVYFALGLPGSALLIPSGAWAGLVTTIAGGLTGLVLFRIFVVTPAIRN